MGRTPLQGDQEKNHKKNHCVTKNLSFCISPREIYKNISSSDLTKEYFPFQIVYLVLSNTN